MYERLRFRERMRGWVSFDQRDFNPAVVAGKRDGVRCSLDVTVEIDDLDAFVHDPELPARLTGSLDCPRLGGTFVARDGDFRLFVAAPDRGRRRIEYRAFMTDAEGRKLTLAAFKLVETDRRHDGWRDTTRLLIRLLPGHVLRGDERVEPVAVGMLRLTPLAFLRTLVTMRGPRVRYLLEFWRRLRDVYAAPKLAERQFDFPAPRLPAPMPSRQGDPLPGRPGLRYRVVPVATADGREINLHHVFDPARRRERHPVLLAGGLAMRANSFYGTPRSKTLVDALIEAGYEPWIENWRTSIDFAQHDFTLDEVAVYDHPAAVRTVLRETGVSELGAVVHCLGSASMTMSVLAGEVPALSRVVTSGLSLHVHLDRESRKKIRYQVPVISLLLDGVNPQWAARAPTLPAAGYGWMARRGRVYGGQPLVAASTYTYGGNPEGMWVRSNLDDATVAWLGREFGYAPFSIFRQIGRSASAGYLKPATGLLADDLVEREPPGKTRFTFLVGKRNRFFLPEGQLETHAHFERMQPGRHSKVELENYSHLDLYIGKRSGEQVFPEIIEALADA